MHVFVEHCAYDWISEPLITLCESLRTVVHSFPWRLARKSTFSLWFHNNTEWMICKWSFLWVRCSFKHIIQNIELFILTPNPPFWVWFAYNETVDNFWSVDPWNVFGHRVFKALLECQLFRDYSFSCILCYTWIIWAFFLKITTTTERLKVYSLKTCVMSLCLCGLL